MKKVAFLVIVILTLLIIVVSVNSTANAGQPWWRLLEPKQKIQNAEMIKFQDKDHVIHLFKPGPVETVSIRSNKSSKSLLFGFEWAFDPPNDNVDALQDSIDDPEHDITLSINGATAFSVKDYYQPAFLAIPGVGPAWTWDHDNDGLDPGDGDGWDDWKGATIFFRYSWDSPEEPSTNAPSNTFEFCVTSPQINFCETVPVEFYS